MRSDEQSIQKASYDSEELDSIIPKEVSLRPDLIEQPAWQAVFAVALGVSGLITSEFLPVSLLTPMAKELMITEGVAG